MNIMIWVFLTLATWHDALAMYHLQTKKVFQPPTNQPLRSNSYFGYSITYDGFDKKLVISAPRENNIGEVYTCSIENRTCAPIDKKNIMKRVSSNYTHDYWFGATVKAGSNFILICAPRYTVSSIQPYSKTHTYATNGKCYSYKTLSGLRELQQISNVDRNHNLPEPILFETTMDSFGWSIDVTRGDSVIVGGPGTYHGRAMIYEQLYVYKVPKLFKIGKIASSSAPKFNFGYGVASGMFINNHMSYAISSPYGTNGHGKVLFFNNKVFLHKYIEDTSHIGSMFGGVLCAAKLLGIRTDLLVGAPTYATKYTYNLGAVYVYLARKLQKVPNYHRKIIGEISGSMFGSAIINVGDLNGDEKDEIAIGAPFEKSGHGVVYLYSGADLINNEIDIKYLQRIEAERSYGESFGMSLTPVLDYDQNGCKELAIGSPYKDTVVLLRCMAAVIVETLTPKFPNLQIRNSSQTDFEFEVCLLVKYPTLPLKIIADLITTVEIHHVSAKLLNANGAGLFTYVTSLIEKEPKYCKNVSMFLDQDGQYETNISYTISSKLLNDPRNMSDFHSSRVILSDLSVLTKHGSVWAAECAGNETCVPNLTFKPYISFHQDDNPYIIGSSKTETMSITVYNDGEVAYEPCVRVHIIGPNVFTTPTGCRHEGLADQNRVVCKPPKPIRTNETWTTGKIVLEMTHLTNLDRNIIINMHLFDHCKEVTSQNTSIILLKADSRGISIKGETDMTQEDVEKNGKKIQHIYTITNKGPTNWKKLVALVNLQKKPYIKYSDTPVTVHHSTSNFLGCRFESLNATSMSYVCLIESLVKLEIAKILIPIYVVPKTLDGILEKNKNMTIISSVMLKFIDDDSKVESIITTITLQEAVPIPIEIMIIAVVVGFCITIIIALILNRDGFLHRKKRNELENLKMEVERQKFLRHSAMMSKEQIDKNRKPILDSIQEGTNDDHTQDLKEA